MANLTSWKAGISPQQIREIDRAAEEDYGIAPLQLMEVAGLATARVARNLMGSPLTSRRVSILAGPGNNGGDGLVAARRLSGWGVSATVLTSYSPEQARGLSSAQLVSAARAGVAVRAWDGRVDHADLVIDALLGFGAQGAPRGAIAEMIAAANAAEAATVALDLPSGLDAGSGETAGFCIEAAATVTLALPKSGLVAAGARRHVGRLFVADIGVPAALLAAHGIDSEGLFDSDDIIEVDPERT